jgi:hypothetical protein
MLALMFGMLAAVAVAVVLLECCRKPFSKAQKRKRTVGNVKYDESKHSDSYDAVPTFSSTRNVLSPATWFCLPALQGDRW